MKKLLILGLVLMLSVPSLFGYGAIVMPAGVGRFYIAPTFSFANSAFDEDGNRESFDDTTMNVFNLGFALEFGLTNWITGAVQWAPGWTPWSDLGEGPLGGTFNTNGTADIFLGAKFNIVGGQHAPVNSDRVRFSAAAGLIIPTGAPDFRDELPKMATGDDVTVSRMDNHVWGIGGRFFFDCIINDNFFINFYNETLLYFGTQSLYNHSLGLAGLSMLPGVTGDVSFRPRLTFSVEPVFMTTLAPGINFGAGLELEYRWTLAPELTITGLPALVPAPEFQDTHRLNLTPSAQIFFMGLPLPLEFKLQYAIPLWGQGVTAMNNVTLQIRAYFAIPAMTGR